MRSSRVGRDEVTVSSALGITNSSMGAEALKWTNHRQGWSIDSSNGLEHRTGEWRKVFGEARHNQVVFDGPVCRRIESSLSLIDSNGRSSSLVGWLQIDLYRSIPWGIIRFRLTNPSLLVIPMGTGIWETKGRSY